MPLKERNLIDNLINNLIVILENEYAKQIFQENKREETRTEPWNVKVGKGKGTK